MQLVLSGRTVSPAIKENDQKEGVDRYRPEGMAELCKVRQPPDAKRQGDDNHYDQPNAIAALHSEVRGAPLVGMPGSPWQGGLTAL